MPVGVKVRGWGSRLMRAPGWRGKKWADAMVAAVGPVKARSPSGVIVAGKGEGVILDGVKRTDSGLGPPVRGRVKWACSGMQMSRQMSQVASACRGVFVTFWAVKGRRMSPVRT